MTRLCVITDYMGDDTTEEESMLSAQDIDVFVAPSTNPTEWIDAAIEADAILTRHAPIERATIEALKKCRIIARYGTGYDNIDADAAAQANIVVTAVVDYATPEVADHAMALILSLVRALPSFQRSIVAGGWTPTPIPLVPRLEGKTLGLFGFGRVGSAVARRASGFGLNTIVYDPYLTQPVANVERITAVEELLGRSEILSLHAPLTDETRGVIDRMAIERLPPGAIIVNVARGGLLDLEAAMDALDHGHLGGLGIDVAAVEPLAADHRIRRHDRAIVTPHVAYYSTGSVIDAKHQSVGEIIRVLNGGEPLHPVRRAAV
jgi:D-3-phosphoglycerate dehydrogenase